LGPHRNEFSPTVIALSLSIDKSEPTANVCANPSRLSRIPLGNVCILWEMYVRYDSRNWNRVLDFVLCGVGVSTEHCTGFAL